MSLSLARWTPQLMDFRYQRTRMNHFFFFFTTRMCSTFILLHIVCCRIVFSRSWTQHKKFKRPLRWKILIENTQLFEFWLVISLALWESKNWMVGQLEEIFFKSNYLFVMQWLMAHGRTHDSTMINGFVSIIIII